MSEADAIRSFVWTRIVQPAKKSGVGEVVWTAGEVARLMGLHNRTPNICQALDGKKFLALIRPSRLTRSGPHASTTVRWKIEFFAEPRRPTIRERIERPLGRFLGVRD